MEEKVNDYGVTECSKCLVRERVVVGVSEIVFRCRLLTKSEFKWTAVKEGVNPNCPLITGECYIVLKLKDEILELINNELKTTTSNL